MSKSINSILLAGVVLLSAMLLCAVAVQKIIVPDIVASVQRNAATHAYTIAATDTHKRSGFITDLTSDQIRLTAALRSQQSGDFAPGELSASLKRLVAKASEAHITFVKMQPGEEEDKNGVVSSPVMIETATSILSFGTFVASIESMPRYFSIERFAISSREDGQLEVRCLIRCLNFVSQTVKS